MKVLIVNDYGAPVGGAERLSLVLRDGLRARGHEARLFTSRARPLPVATAADDTCFGSDRLRPLLQIANPAAFVGLRNVLARFQPDVVHVRMFMTQLSPLILPLLHRHAAVLHVVNYQTICPLNTRRLPDGSPCRVTAGRACRSKGCVSVPGLARTVVQLGLWRQWRRVFDVIVANSRWTMERLREAGVDVRLSIPNGMPARPPRPPLEDPPTIAFAGRLVRKKGIHVLLAALARVTAELPEVRLLIAGDGPDRAEVQRAIAEGGFGNRVTLYGHVDPDALEHRLAPAWVQVLPSEWDEPFGNVVIEAMLRGTAVVASAAGGPVEVVRSGQTGLLVRPRDPHALADALLAMLRDRERAEAMGRAARNLALQEYVEDRVVERFIDVYRSLVPESEMVPARAA